MPKEELSLDVIKQYTVVRAHVLHSGICTALDPRTACVSWHTYACLQMCQHKRNLRQTAVDGCCMCCPQRCPTRDDKTVVLTDMIFPLCEKLGQTIIFVRTRDTARRLHQHVSHACTLPVAFVLPQCGFRPYLLDAGPLLLSHWVPTLPAARERGSQVHIHPRRYGEG